MVPSLARPWHAPWTMSASSISLSRRSMDFCEAAGEGVMPIFSAKLSSGGPPLVDLHLGQGFVGGTEAKIDNYGGTSCSSPRVWRYCE